jgi:hypothetical protein
MTAAQQPVTGRCFTSPFSHHSNIPISLSFHVPFFHLTIPLNSDNRGAIFRFFDSGVQINVSHAFMFCVSHPRREGSHERGEIIWNAG